MFLFKSHGGLFVMASDGSPPTDLEWGRLVDAILCSPASLRPGMAAIVYTEGGVPSSSQRRQVAAIIGDRAPVSILSTSPLARMAVLALSILNPSVRSYHPHRILDACGHLGLDRARTAWASAAMADLLGDLRSASRE